MRLSAWTTAISSLLRSSVAPIKSLSPSSTKFGYTSRKHGFTPWKRSAPQAIEDIPISSEHVGVQVKRKNLAFAGFLATHSLMKQTNTKP
jgi:hypothetical protein